VAGLPAGTVTFLFTDVEGSTRLLLRELGDAYPDALGEHRKALRDWGAVETATAFVPAGPWPREHRAPERKVLALGDVAFETGREAGRSLSLEEAATWMCALD
jgi:hypothetical protein